MIRTEAQLQAKVEALLDLYAWTWYHTHDSRRSRPGFLDLTAVKGERVLFVELKKDGGYPTPFQRLWIADLYRAGREVGVWWPRDLPTAARVLGPAQEPLAPPVRYRTMEQTERLQILAKMRTGT